MSSGPSYPLYEFYGVELPEEVNGSNQYVADCPFCGHENHFFIDAETGLYQCKDGACAEEGNPYTFMARYYEKCLQETVPFSYKKLSYCRKKFHKDIYEQEGVAFSSDLGAFILPDRNAKGSIVNLGVYSGKGPVYGAPGVSLHLFGLDSLQENGPIFICEGRWDRYALLWLLRHMKEPPETYTVLGAPGASNLPKGDLDYLSGREVYLLYDNDDAGRKGSKTAAKKLASVASSVHILTWPEGRFEEGYDIEDLVREATDRPDAVWHDITSWCFRFQQGADPTKPAPSVTRNSMEELLNDFKETGVHMYPGLIDCLALTSAVVYSAQLQGEPLWLYVIGDPGRGKSLVLESTLGSSKCVYRTSVTHKAFISGFRIEGNDHALLAQLPGRALIVKDYSNVLSLPHIEQDQLVSLLREAYDGKVCRNWGNNVYREYPPPGSEHNDCRFAFVAGVTKEIHARSHAGLGERFLKYEIPCTEQDNMAAMMAAIDDSWKTHERQILRSAAVGAFLDRPIDFRKLPSIPRWFKERLISLSQFVGYARSPVSRTKGDLDYSPAPESGTRILKQLLKLSQSLCYVLNLEEANEEVYRIIKKVAWDTSHSWRRDLMITLFHQDTLLDTNEVTEASGLSLGTAHRQLHDMRALKIATARKQDGHMFWSLNERSRNLITAANLEGMI